MYAGLNYTLSRNTFGSGGYNGQAAEKDQMFSLSLSIPLDRLMSNTRASYNMNGSRQGGTHHSLGLNGSLLEDNNLNWSLQGSYDDQNRSTSTGGNLNWQTSSANMSAGYYEDEYSRTLNYGISGGALIHGDGLTLSQSLGETVALVKAPGATGADML
jgi:outer membrane usher protein